MSRMSAPWGSAAALLLLASLGAAPAATAQPTPGPTLYHRWHEGLRAARPDAQRGARVTDLTLERDEATLQLRSGTLHLLEDVEGRTFGVLFVGDGRLTFAPPVDVEREQLLRHYGKDELAEDFTTAVLLFTDRTLDELSAAVEWAPLAPPSTAAKAVEEALGYLVDDEGWISRDLAVPLLNRTPSYFSAFVARDLGNPFMLEINPFDAEEVSLYRRAEGRGLRRETVARFHKRADYEAGTSLPQEALDLVRPDRYDVAIELGSNLDLTGSARATLDRVQAGHDWVPFTLHADLTVDSVRSAGGAPVPFARPRKSSELWIDLTGLGDATVELAFYYHGDLMDRSRNLWVEMKTFTDWYPYHAYDRLASYRLSFTTHRRYTVATVGSLVSEAEDGDRITRVWDTGPVRQVGFNVGEFETYEVQEQMGPPLTVQLSERAHRELNDLAFRAGVLLNEQRDMGQVVGSDLSRAFAFFGQAFGPTPSEGFVATEIPYGHGQAFPGMVLLSWSTFQETDEQGFDEMFRAHEVAHQWWGIGVRPATYHDRWLAEGFSEFSGLWYMARVRGSADLYGKRLRDSREALLERRDKAPPLWLGSRVASSRDPEDYQAVVYGKGAWVLHMLRQLLLDHEGGSEDAFEKLMKDFYARYQGKAATTEQFMQVAQESTGYDLSWFFRQWVYGSAIPTYVFSHRLEEQPDGSWKAFVRVRQENVPDDFQMAVPVRVDFGDAGDAVVRIGVVGPLTETELPLLPMKPLKVEFNAFDAVLAETKTEGWKN